MATRVWRYCKKKDDIEKLISIKDGSKNKKYYHDDCYEKQVREDEIRKIDIEERKELLNTITKIYNIKHIDIPKEMYSFLANIRNGNPVFGKTKNDIKHKQGYSYKVIDYTYRNYYKYIRDVRRKKNFNSISGELKYGLYIIMDKIYGVNKKYENYKKSKRLFEMKKIQNDYTNNYKKNKKENENDISSFLN